MRRKRLTNARKLTSSSTEFDKVQRERLADSEFYWDGLSWRLVEQLQVDRDRVFDATNALLMTLTTEASRFPYSSGRRSSRYWHPIAPVPRSRKSRPNRCPTCLPLVKSPFTTSNDDSFCKVTIFPGNSQLLRLPNSVIGLIDCGKFSVRWIIEALADYRIRAGLHRGHSLGPRPF